MKQTTKTVDLWAGIHEVSASISHHADRIDVTALGDVHPRYVSGPVRSLVNAEIACDLRAWALLHALLQTQPTYDPVSQRYVLAVDESAVVNALGPGSGKGALLDWQAPAPKPGATMDASIPMEMARIIVLED